MADPSTVSSLSSNLSNSGDADRSRRRLWPLAFLLSVLLPVLIAVLLYQLDSFDPAPFPMHELTQTTMAVPRRNPRMLHGSEKIGFGQLLGPEDIAYDPNSKLIYTGCVDGWVKRVTVNDSVAESVVENWVNTGGRPLGLAFGHSGELIIADADKGLLKVGGDGEIELLTDEADGLKFKLTDAVVISQNGTMYFTDGSHKYGFHEAILDLLEGRPHGRFMSYDPSTKQTKVIAHDLYFANGVSLSPDEEFVIVCETLMRRCKKYYLQGEKEGSIEVFVDNLPGMPDNIRYDGKGHYWIALVTENSYAWELAQRYPLIRKVIGMMEKFVGRPPMEKNGGAIAVDLEGKPTELYYDPGLSMVSSGIKIGDHLYCGTLGNSYIIRLNLTKYPAVAAT